MTFRETCRRLLHVFRVAEQRRRGALILSIAAIVAACAESGTGPNDPGSIEFAPFAAPALVLGDTLRNVDGVATPVVALVRNLHGDILQDIPIQYVYADASRDTSVKVDSNGYVVSLKPLGSVTVGTTVTPATTVRIAARFGEALQVIRTITITTRPDSVDRGSATTVDTLRAALPDSSNGLARNVSSALSVTVRHLDTTSAYVAVPTYLVKFEVLLPANATGDSTRGAFMVNDNGIASSIDTTDGSGVATRYVRVRPSIFPATTTPDSVVVRATVTYRPPSHRASDVTCCEPSEASSRRHAVRHSVAVTLRQRRTASAGRHDQSVVFRGRGKVRPPECVHIQGERRVGAAVTSHGARTRAARRAWPQGTRRGRGRARRAPFGKPT
jgi:hypothetical protein